MAGTLDVQIPVILWFKRQAIRNFPDNTKVATYYNDRLNKTITIPFTTIGISESSNHSPEALKQLAARLEDKIKQAIKQFDEKVHKEVESMKSFKSRNHIKEELDADEIAAYKARRAWRKKKKEPVNELSKTLLKSYVKKSKKDSDQKRSDADFYWDTERYKDSVELNRKADQRSKYRLTAQSKLKEDSDKENLKQIKKWINNTRTTMAAGEYNGNKNSDRFKAHLVNLNKEKKDARKEIKAKFAKINAERTAPKSKKQLNLKLD